MIFVFVVWRVQPHDRQVKPGSPAFDSGKNSKCWRLALHTGQLMNFLTMKAAGGDRVLEECAINRHIRLDNYLVMGNLWLRSAGHGGPVRVCEHMKLEYQHRVQGWDKHMVELTLFQDYEEVSKPYRYNPPCCTGPQLRKDVEFWREVLPAVNYIINMVQVIQGGKYTMTGNNQLGPWTEHPIVVWAAPVWRS